MTAFIDKGVPIYARPSGRNGPAHLAGRLF